MGPSTPVFSGTSTTTMRCPILTETLPNGEALPVPRPNHRPASKFVTPATESTPGHQRTGGDVLLRPADNNSSIRRHLLRAHPRRRLLPVRYSAFGRWLKVREIRHTPYEVARSDNCVFRFRRNIQFCSIPYLLLR